MLFIFIYLIYKAVFFICCVYLLTGRTSLFWGELVRGFISQIGVCEAVIGEYYWLI